MSTKAGDNVGGDIEGLKIPVAQLRTAGQSFLDPFCYVGNNHNQEKERVARKIAPAKKKTVCKK